MANAIMSQNTSNIQPGSSAPYISMVNGNDECLETFQPLSETHMSSQEIQLKLSSSNQSLAGTPPPRTRTIHSTDRSDTRSNGTIPAKIRSESPQPDLLLEIGAWANVSQVSCSAS
ncbi:uncharacterized protein F4807DRAFT_448905 [Annulohypoxylon truncatum]|uniref:uncharacterized protein n=1 Tax=Annulohypoxylon truncatum TaxID=327061 RepID=UPI002008492E|nr:uncharacterized protein F4807DRAFT_448905 [Annulohypoxylon truncatum]KAI1204112.1 hypothetical protein F4807DRAFT_448905 [Annulohypoxylon truncatum]